MWGNSGVLVQSSFPYFTVTSAQEAIKSQKMQETGQGRFLNPRRAFQLSEEIEDPANRYFEYDECDPPEGAHAHVSGGEATIFLSFRAATQAVRVFARFARSKKAPDPIIPAGPVISLHL